MTWTMTAVSSPPPSDWSILSRANAVSLYERAAGLLCSSPILSGVWVCRRFDHRSLTVCQFLTSFLWQDTGTDVSAYLLTNYLRCGREHGSRSSRTSGQVVLGQVVLKSSRTSSERVPESIRTRLSRTFILVSRCYTFSRMMLDACTNRPIYVWLSVRYQVNTNCSFLLLMNFHIVNK